MYSWRSHNASSRLWVNFVNRISSGDKSLKTIKDLITLILLNIEDYICCLRDSYFVSKSFIRKGKGNNT